MAMLLSNWRLILEGVLLAGMAILYFSYNGKVREVAGLRRELEVAAVQYQMLEVQRSALLVELSHQNEEIEKLGELAKKKQATYIKYVERAQPKHEEELGVAILVPRDKECEFIKGKIDEVINDLIADSAI